MSMNLAESCNLQLVFGAEEFLGQWVGQQLLIDDWGDFTAIGVANEKEIIAGIIYNNYHKDTYGHPLFIEMSIASIDRRWCSRYTIGALFRYPFIQLKVKRVQSTVSKRNKRVRQFLERIGFKLEGIGRQAWPQGGDAAVYSMLKPECKWIK